MTNSEFYALEAKTLRGQEVKMDEYKDKVVLVVNTASKCGLTPQYEGLEKLYEKYREDGLVILGFPSNQFANQEPGSAGDIEEFCQVNYGVSFPMLSKVDVNGNHTHPVFEYLKSKLSGLLGKRVKWNFTKFLLDRNGQPIKRFAPTTTPDKIEPYIKELLDEK
jgi:glutathione peroxidase